LTTSLSDSRSAKKRRIPEESTTSGQSLADETNMHFGILLHSLLIPRW
jgi:hypothetical protein